MAPRPFRVRALPEVSGLKARAPAPPPDLPPPARKPGPVAPAPVEKPMRTPVAKPAGPASATVKPGPRAPATERPVISTTRAEKAVAPRPPPASPEVPAGRVPAVPEPKDGRDQRPMSLAEELDDTVAQIEALQATPFRRKAPVRAEGQGRLSWLWAAFVDSLRNHRDLGHRLAAWWRHWRTTASCRVLAAFIVVYALLAFIRAPSEVVVEQSRRTEEITLLQDFLRDYRAAGGAVLAEKPHGGSELYPRGVVLKGEMLAAFVRTPVGEVFVVHTTSPDSNPLAGFYGFPPIYLGGSYFHLERKFNFALYRCSYLIRKDSEQAGTMLMARVEPAQ